MRCAHQSGNDGRGGGGPPGLASSRPSPSPGGQGRSGSDARAMRITQGGALGNTVGAETPPGEPPGLTNAPPSEPPPVVPAPPGDDVTADPVPPSPADLIVAVAALLARQWPRGKGKRHLALAVGAMVTLPRARGALRIAAVAA